MGNASSSSQVSPTEQVFAKELALMNHIVTSIMTDDGVFKNKQYNFLSEDICSKYQVVLETELMKHMKVHVTSLGTSMYILPKAEDEKRSLAKKAICEKISGHYIQILYILSLLKHVFNLEHNGDRSIAGIIFRNIRIMDDVMEINFCNIPHKDYERTSLDKTKIDFGKLDGFRIFIEYFLDSSEASVFLGIVRAILSRSKPKQVETAICKGKFSKKEMMKLEELYENRYNKKLHCQVTTIEQPPKFNRLSLDVFVEKDNPILSKNLCYSPSKILIKTSTKDGKKVLSLYNDFLDHYKNNLACVTDLINDLVTRTITGEYILKEITSEQLMASIDKVKEVVKMFYLQSILDYHKLLDAAKLIPNIVQ